RSCWSMLRSWPCSSASLPAAAGNGLETARRLSSARTAKADNREVKGLEKLTSIRLAEVLSQKGTIPTEKITDALYAQDKHGEPFAEALVTAGHITEWDLAKVVVENFQLPFLMASNYDIQKEAASRLPEETIFETQIVPLDVCGNLVTVVMPIMTPYE